MLSSQPTGSPSPFEEQLQAIEGALDFQFGAKISANLVENVRALRRLKVMNKFELESLLSQKTIISLNDEEYGRLQTKIANLLAANEAAARKQGIFDRI